MIYEYVSSPTFSFLINRSAYGFLKPSREIREGHPMSLALFTIVFDVLFRLLSKAKLEGRLHVVKVSRTSPTISHPMYAYDLVVFYRANKQGADMIAECLNTFTSWFGLLVNQSKPVIHFSKNVTVEVKGRILNRFRMGKYDYHENI